MITKCRALAFLTIKAFSLMGELKVATAAGCGAAAAWKGAIVELDIQTKLGVGVESDDRKWLCWENKTRKSFDGVERVESGRAGRTRRVEALIVPCTTPSS